MNFALNMIFISFLLGISLLYLYFLFKEGEREEEPFMELSLPYLVVGIKESFSSILNTNVSELRLKKAEMKKRENLKIKLKKALRTCSYGDIGQKEYVKDYIKELLQRQFHVNENNINQMIPFHERNLLSCQDKFEILLHLAKKEYGYDALEFLIKNYGLDEKKYNERGAYYQITEEDIEQIFDNNFYTLSFGDKLDILTQRIYQMYKGHGVIDEIRDMKIDGISGGVSGGIKHIYNYMEELKNPLVGQFEKGYHNVWIMFHGKTIYLSFLSFQNQQELERICKNIYRYNQPGQLSASCGYKVNDLYDGARVVVVRPPFSETWAFFLRKFENSRYLKIEDLIIDHNSNLPIQLMRWLIKGCQVIGITGEQGCGKTTLLKSLVQFIDQTYTLRIQELVFELSLRNLYPDRNIITFRETEGVSGQEGLDLQKKTDGVVNILGEVASAPVAAWVVQLSQVGTKMTMFTNHATSTQKLIEYFRNSLLSTNLFHNEKIAEEQVIHTINFDIHMSKDRDGHRYIERITEIIPLKREPLEDHNICSYMKEYLHQGIQEHPYTLVDLLVYEEGEYRLVNKISKEKIAMIQSNLEIEERGMFEEFLEYF